nr:MAG TPA: hypothetical protein [Caudoviricetes sp.]
MVIILLLLNIKLHSVCQPSSIDVKILQPQ